MQLLLIILICQGVRIERKKDEVLLTNMPKRLVTNVKRKTSKPDFQPIIDRICRKYNMDPALINLIIKSESGFNPKAKSPKGAIGLMQLMPETARQLGINDPYDPKENIEGGVRFLKLMLNRYKSLELALAAYHAGPRAVEKSRGVPKIPETVSYVNYILSRYSGSYQEKIFCRVKTGQVIFTNVSE